MRRLVASPRAALVALLAALLVAAAAALLVRSHRGTSAPPVPTPPGATGAAARTFPDPFAWTPARSAAFSRRAAAGAAHPLYAFSPGGAAASAARTARWRPLVERAARRARVDPDRLEALVLLESAGRPDAQAPGGVQSATGLTQILAETGRHLLGMHVDTRASARLTRRLARAERRGRVRRVRRLERARERADERYDPAKALAGTARYLAIALHELHRQDLAFVSYHMGIGNLQGVLRRYGEGTVPYAQLYFDSTPARHAGAYRRLAGFGDASSTYWWRLAAAEEIMRLWRRDPARLARTAALQTRKASAEEVLHPEDSTQAFGSPAALQRAWDSGELRRFPDAPALTGLRRDRRMGELARRLRRPAALYQGLRPEALALALYVGAQVRALNGGRGTLTVTSTVRDEAYQRLLIRRNPEATQAYSLHTTGYALDVLRSYASRRQALAFQFVLDRLQILDVIAWVREPRAIHLTVSRDAQALLPLLDRLGGAR